MARTRPTHYPNIGGEMGKKGITQKQLAEELGMDEKSMSFKLANKREFKASELKAMAKLFGVSIDYLLEK